MVYKGDESCLMLFLSDYPGCEASEINIWQGSKFKFEALEYTLNNTNIAQVLQLKENFQIEL